MAEARLICGDALEVLREMPNASVHCCVTSPPYFGLRDYGTGRWEGGSAECDHKLRTRETVAKQVASSTLRGGKGTTGFQQQSHGAECPRCGARRVDQQIGLESTLGEYVARLVEVFRAVKRVLRDDGTLWLNLGDSYGSGETGRVDLSKYTGHGGIANCKVAVKDEHKFSLQKSRSDRRIKQRTSLSSKNLLGVPWRVAFALQDDGWILRSEIIWAKPNPMPESVRDRPTKSHETIFLLAKQSRYFYDGEAAKEPLASRPYAPGNQKLDGRNYHNRLNRVWGASGYRNLRDVWTVASQPFRGRHFAVFPQRLIEPCVKAGTSERGCCSECGAPWVPVVERTAMVIDRSKRTHEKGQTRASGTMLAPPTSTTTGWLPSCDCLPVGDPLPCTVLDPFAGAATTGLVALNHGRNFIGVELNPEYVALAQRRLDAARAPEPAL